MVAVETYAGIPVKDALRFKADRMHTSIVETYAGIPVKDAERLKKSEVENIRLKKLLGRSRAGQGHAQGASRNKMVPRIRRRVAVKRLLERSRRIWRQDGLQRARRDAGLNAAASATASTAKLRSLRSNHVWALDSPVRRDRRSAPDQAA